MQTITDTNKQNSNVNKSLTHQAEGNLIGSPIQTEVIVNGEEPQESIMSIDNEELGVLIKATSQLSTMKRVVSVKRQYKRFEKEGEMARGIFVDFDKIPNSKQEILDSVVWIEEDGNVFYHSGVILVDECRKFNLRKGVGIEIVYKGKKKGRTMDFDIFILQNQS